MSDSNLRVSAKEIPPQQQRRPSWHLWLLGVAVAILALSLLRIVTGAGDVASSGTFGAAIGLAMPIAMAGLGGLWAERAGVVNIGLEGMMVLGTFGAGWIGYQYGPWQGVVAAVAFGAVGGLLHAIATVTFGVDHIISGVAINILGPGVTAYLAAVVFEGVPGGGESQSPPIGNLPVTPSIPGWSDALATVENNDWFFLSELAAVLLAVTNRISVLTVIGALLIIATYFILWRTPFGLRLRSCGENPVAAESLGVNVYLYKYIAVIASGTFAGLGGAFLAIVAASAYREGQTVGIGFIGLAAMIFGNWRPGGLVAGAGLFGFASAMRLRGGGESVHSILLLLAVGLFALALYLLVRRSKAVQAAIAAGAGAVILVWFFATDEVAGAIAAMTPYVATLLVLAFASQRLRMPAADGMVYRRGQGG